MYTGREGEVQELVNSNYAITQNEKYNKDNARGSNTVPL